MRVYLKVVTRSSQNKIVEMADGSYKVWVTVAPEKGKANQAVIKLLSKYFKVAKSQIEIVGGKTAREKIVDVDLDTR